MYADYKIIFVINKDPGGQIRSVSWSSRSARPFASCSLARWADSGWQKCGNSVEMCMSDHGVFFVGATQASIIG